MKTAAFTWLLMAVAIIGLGARAPAEDSDVGKTEYENSCGACHGTDAKGNGPVGKELKTPPTDLTVLARNNNGVFPYNKVYEIIDGRNSTIGSHGSREMPIWGYRFSPPQAFRYKQRILAVIDYLNRIQEK
jgi:mono/diheme cytochrome c family protein